jgi:hypothetical protein
MSKGEINSPIRLIDWQVSGGDTNDGPKFLDAKLILRDEEIRLQLSDGREIFIELQDDILKIHAYNATSDGPANINIKRSEAISTDLTAHLNESHGKTSADTPAEALEPLLTKRYHCSPANNTYDILCDGIKPAIGPRSKRIGEDVPAVHLFETLDLVDDAISGWLGDVLQEDGVSKVAIFEVVLDEKSIGTDLVNDGFSMSCTKLVPASAIRHLRTESLDE